MRTRRLTLIASAALIGALGIASAAQAAYTASGTLYGTDSGQISTVECRAAITSLTADDSARTLEVEGEECSTVSVKVYYTNSSGYAGWSSTVSHASRAVKDLSGSDQLRRSYHTATR